MFLGIYLGLKELWRDRGKFILFSLVIALITFLVLFITALGEGLAVSNKEYIEKLNAQLLVYRKNSDLNIQASRLDQSDLRGVRRVEGVRDAGLLGLSSVSIRDPRIVEPLDVAMLGVEPGHPGEPPTIRGRPLERRRAEEAIIDINVARLGKLDLGDTLTVRSVQGADEKFYALLVVGISDSRKITFNPAIFVPILTWEKIKPQAVVGQDEANLVANVIAVQLDYPEIAQQIVPIIEAQVSDVEAADLVTAYKATPGYQAQQSTLNTQRNFLLLIAVLIIGGFFQIQTLQKVAQIGMLKAIGSSNTTVAVAVLLQIVLVTVVGTAMGGLASLGLSLTFPPTVPIVFEPAVVLSAVVYLLIIGPLGGLVSIRYALKVEPLMALGLSG